MTDTFSKEDFEELHEKLHDRFVEVKANIPSEEDEYAAVLADHYGILDRKAAELAFDIDLSGRGEQTDGKEALAKACREKLSAVFDVDKEELDTVRQHYEDEDQLEDIIHVDNEDLADSPSDNLTRGFGGIEELAESMREHEAAADEMLLVHDPDGEVSDLLNEIEETDLEFGDVCVGRRRDIKTAKETRESLIEGISQDKGIDREEIEHLTLASLRRLSTDSNGSNGQGSPAPRSGDVKKDETVPRGKGDKLADLREREEFYEGRSGPLAEKGLKAVRQEIEDLKGL